MAEFGPAFDFMMSHEDAARSGAVTNEPNGGVAKFGINSIANPGVDVPSLTIDQAQHIYRNRYWAPVFEQIASQPVASKLFDMGVNMGFKQAVKLLQRAINSYSLPSIAVDGVLGPVTLQRVNSGPANVVLAALCVKAKEYYLALAAKEPQKYSSCVGGWLARAKSLPPDALA